MNQKLMLRVSLCCCGLLSFMDSSMADRKAHEFYFQQNQQRFVVQPQEARMFGMAGSTAMTSANALSTVTNPGGLGRMRYGDLSLGYSKNEITGHTFPEGASVEDSQDMGQVYGATPLGPRLNELPEYGNLGFGWFGRSGDWDNGPAQAIEDTDSDTYQLSAGYGAAVGEKASLGYSLTYLHDTFDSRDHSYDSAGSFQHNLGMQFFDDPATVWGASLIIGHGEHNLNHRIDGRRNQDVDQLNVGIAGGVEHAMDDVTLSGGVDYTYYDNSGDNSLLANDPESVFGGDSTGHAMNVRVGFEHRAAEWFAWRLGYRYAANFDWDYDRDELDDLSGSAKYNAYTAGAGLHFAMDEGSFIRALNIDYGVEFRDVGDNDWQHYVTMSTPFDLCA
jgi:hypothetical protein